MKQTYVVAVTTCNGDAFVRLCSTHERAEKSARKSIQKQLELQKEWGVEDAKIDYFDDDWVLSWNDGREVICEVKIIGLDVDSGDEFNVTND